MNAFQKTAIATVIATTLLISVGGIVRVTGAGLGCPDWPRCWGCWFPPSSVSEVDMAYVESKGYDIRAFNPVKMWTEYINRMIGVLIGLLVTATWILSFRYRLDRPVLFRIALASVLLVGFQGWLGGQVVRSELHPGVITLHMLLAVVLICALLYVAFHSFRSRFKTPLAPRSRVRLFRLGTALFFITTVQILLGTQVREGIDPFIKDPGGVPRNQWLSQVGSIDYIHRSTSWLALIAGALFLYDILRNRITGALRNMSFLVVCGIAVQMALGVILAYAALPRAAQTLHLTVATMLVCVEFMTLLMLREEIPSSPEGVLPRAPVLHSGLADQQGV